MKDEKNYSHPNVGSEIRVMQRGKEVAVIFVAGDEVKAAALHDSLLECVKQGEINIKIGGTITRIVKDY